MSDIVNINDSRQHITCVACCEHCWHVWSAVFPEGTEKLECPKCHDDTVIYTPMSPTDVAKELEFPMGLDAAWAVSATIYMPLLLRIQALERHLMKLQKKKKD